MRDDVGATNTDNLSDFECVLLARQLGYPNRFAGRVPVPCTWDLDLLSCWLTAIDYDDLDLVKWLRFGWPVNCHPFATWPILSRQNHTSAVDFPEFVNNYISKELSLHALVGPFAQVPFDRWVAVSPVST